MTGIVALLAAALLAAFGARLAGGDHAATPHSSASGGPATPAATAPATAPQSPSAAPAIPATKDPITFGQDFASALWSYDATASRTSYLDALAAWLTPETQYADPASVTTQVPSAQLWDEMGRQHQHATVTGVSGHIPAEFTAALNTNPGALDVAYIYAVTVTGSQHIAWNGGQGTESRALTLAVQCHPDQACTLAAVSPTVYP
jgi:hypothetical protein